MTDLCIEEGTGSRDSACDQHLPGCNISARMTQIRIVSSCIVSRGCCGLRIPVVYTVHWQEGRLGAFAAEYGGGTGGGGGGGSDQKTKISI